MQKHLIVGSLITLSIGCLASDITRNIVPDTYVSAVQKHVSCLRGVCNNECISRFVDLATFLQDNSAIAYNHELTRLTLKKIGVEGNLIPLFDAWDIFLKNYRAVDADLFLREFSVQLFFIYKNIFSHYNEQKVTILEIMHLSSQIMSLPIDQVLTALERCYHQFMIIMGQYGMNQGLSFSAWINRYWWVPPVVVISFVFSAVRHFLLGRAGNIGLPNLQNLA